MNPSDGLGAGADMERTGVETLIFTAVLPLGRYSPKFDVYPIAVEKRIPPVSSVLDIENDRSKLTIRRDEHLQAPLTLIVNKAVVSPRQSDYPPKQQYQNCLAQNDKYHTSQ